MPAPGQSGAGETKTGWMNSTTSPPLTPPSILTTLLFQVELKSRYCPGRADSLLAVPWLASELLNRWHAYYGPLCIFSSQAIC
ncbi:hypothetical protein M405DRAFT_483740 [Rhizopogon salebrosus TDB-379]|nr:hypothetical protein M405DRAFT_483740 [Rhizopogon salebrosus TDB-379]